MGQTSSSTANTAGTARKRVNKRAKNSQSVTSVEDDANTCKLAFNHSVYQREWIITGAIVEVADLSVSGRWYHQRIRSNYSKKMEFAQSCSRNVEFV